MRRAGQFVVLIGVLIIALGAGQLLLAEALATDPNPNLIGNGILMTLGWIVGITVIGIGLVIGRSKGSEWV